MTTRTAAATDGRETRAEDPGRAILEVGGLTAAGAVAGRLLAGRPGTVLGAAVGAVAGTVLALARLAEAGVRPRRRGPSPTSRPDLEEAAPYGERPDREGTDREEKDREEKEEAAGDARDDRTAGRQRPERRPSSARERLAARTKAELYEKAQEVDIGGRSRMRKDELVDALLERGVSDLGG